MLPVYICNSKSVDLEFKDLDLLKSLDKQRFVIIFQKTVIASLETSVFYFKSIELFHFQKCLEYSRSEAKQTRKSLEDLIFSSQSVFTRDSSLC